MFQKPVHHGKTQVLTTHERSQDKEAQQPGATTTHPLSPVKISRPRGLRRSWHDSAPRKTQHLNHQHQTRDHRQELVPPVSATPILLTQKLTILQACMKQVCLVSAQTRAVRSWVHQSGALQAAEAGQGRCNLLGSTPAYNCPASYYLTLMQNSEFLTKSK